MEPATAISEYEGRDSLQTAHAAAQGALSVDVENLTPEGWRLKGAPPSWSSGQQVGLRLAVGNGYLRLEGRVTWRRGNTVNVVLTPKTLPTQ